MGYKGLAAIGRSGFCSTISSRELPKAQRHTQHLRQMRTLYPELVDLMKAAGRYGSCLAGRSPTSLSRPPMISW
jgi:hypothetical protein